MVDPKEVFYHNTPDLPTFLSPNTLHKTTQEKMGVSDGLNMYFTTRAARDDFVSILPENVDWFSSQTVHIVDDAVYYYQHVRVFLSPDLCVDPE